MVFNRGALMAIARRYWLFIASGMIALAVGGWLLRCVIEGVSVMKHADLAFRATLKATDVVNKYVRERGRWPASWEDLESVPIIGDTEHMSPGDWDEMRAYVEIDFNLTVDEVAKQSAETFEGIRPIEPVWRNYRHYFTPLLQTVRNVRDRPARSRATPHASPAGDAG